MVTLEDVLDSEFRHAPGNGVGFTAGNDGEFDAVGGEALDAVTVPDVEDLDLFAAGAEKDTAVRENPVDVENRESDRFGQRSQIGRVRGFRRLAVAVHMAPACRRS